MKNILLPTDFSTNAENALNYAIALARPDDAKIILLNVLAINDNDLPQQINIAQKRSEEGLKSLAAKVSNAGLICEDHIRKGATIKEILEFIEEKEIDLVVMGTKGQSNFSNVVFGSNATHVIEKAKCPVIALPIGARYEPVKKITYATDYHDCDFLVLKKVCEMAKAFNAQVNVLHIANENESPVEEKMLMEKFRKKVQEKTEYNNISFQMLSSKNIKWKLKDYLETESANMIVMSTCQRGLWETLFGNSLTDQMACISPVPVMAFHYNKEAAVKLI